MKSNDPYFQAFDMMIGYDATTFTPKKKFPITKLESLTMALAPGLATYLACISESLLMMLFAAFWWAFFAYVHIKVYMNECRK